MSPLQELQALVKRLKRRGFTQVDIAEAVGCGQSTISEIELNTFKRGPGWELVSRLLALDAQTRAMRRASHGPVRKPVRRKSRAARAAVAAETG